MLWGGSPTPKITLEFFNEKKNLKILLNLNNAKFSIIFCIYM